MKDASSDTAKKIAGQLHRLATSDTDRPLAARFRDVYLDIEAALKAGVPHEKVCQTLEANGIPMKLTTFRSLLHRCRSRMAPTTNEATRAAQPAAASSIPAPAPVSGAAQGDSIRSLATATPDLDSLARIAKRKKP